MGAEEVIQGAAWDSNTFEVRSSKAVFLTPLCYPSRVPSTQALRLSGISVRNSVSVDVRIRHAIASSGTVEGPWNHGGCGREESMKGLEGWGLPQGDKR